MVNDTCQKSAVAWSKCAKLVVSMFHAGVFFDWWVNVWLYDLNENLWFSSALRKFGSTTYEQESCLGEVYSRHCRNSLTDHKSWCMWVHCFATRSTSHSYWILWLPQPGKWITKYLRTREDYWALHGHVHVTPHQVSRTGSWVCRQGRRYLTHFQRALDLWTYARPPHFWTILSW